MCHLVVFSGTFSFESIPLREAGRRRCDDCEQHERPILDRDAMDHLKRRVVAAHHRCVLVGSQAVHWTIEGRPRVGYHRAVRSPP